MEISSLLNSLLSRSPHARADASAEITSIEYAKPGTRLSATVENIRDISATQKQTLLNQLNGELSQLKTASQPPDPRGLSTQALSTQALSTQARSTQTLPTSAASPHPLPDSKPPESTPSS